MFVIYRIIRALALYMILDIIALPERKDAIELKKMLEVGNLTADLRVVKVNRASLFGPSLRRRESRAN